MFRNVAVCLISTGTSSAGRGENEQTEGQEPSADNDRSHPAGLVLHYRCAQSRPVMAFVVQVEIDIFGLLLLIQYIMMHICAEVGLEKPSCTRIEQGDVLRMRQ